jgi:hypothetical protein
MPKKSSRKSAPKRRRVAKTVSGSRTLNLSRLPKAKLRNLAVLAGANDLASQAEEVTKPVLVEKMSRSAKITKFLHDPRWFAASLLVTGSGVLAYNIGKKVGHKKGYAIGYKVGREDYES